MFTSIHSDYVAVMLPVFKIHSFIH